MGCFQWLLLTLIQLISGQRTTGGIYHLLKGKRSSQTIQDAYLFKCSQFVCSLKDITRSGFNEAIREMEVAGLITKVNEDVVQLTSKGQSKLHELNQVYHLPKGYNGGKYEWNGSAPILWDRLSLTVQSLSNLNYKNKQFLPVSYEISTQKWVKQLFREFGNNYRLVSSLLFENLHALLLQLDDRESNLFVKRLSGFPRSGKTYAQLSVDFQQDPLLTKLYFHSIIHKIFDKVKNDPDAYSIVHTFINDLNEHQFVTKSARETNLLLRSGKSMEQIMRIRSLKKSTIEDHLVELALYESDFAYTLFIEEKGIEEILKVAKELNTKKLKRIKDELPDYNYFQIRLALTKIRNGKMDG
ncbi:MAG: helix-turn-helix domain-containing protein [Bacillus sp. (in: Bacteria)]|nr:helix-turn-helix domain-containing protein [Bacillus sp. (in: firmicutes)]